MKAQDWIKVQDSVPAFNEDVLVYDDLQGVVIASYDGFNWVSYEHGVLEEVTHWVELELPKRRLWETI